MRPAPRASCRRKNGPQPPSLCSLSFDLTVAKSRARARAVVASGSGGAKSTAAGRARGALEPRIASNSVLEVSTHPRCGVMEGQPRRSGPIYPQDDDSALCSLCLQDYAVGDEITRLPNCGHTFHKACVTRWLGEAQRGKKRRCPMCNLDPLASPLPVTTPPATPSSSSSPATLRA